MHRLGLTNLREVKLMNGIWVPITVTLLMLILVIWDIWDEREQFKKQWFLSCVALSIKPGLLVAASWIIWYSYF